MYVFMFCLCATGGCETASYTCLFRHISVLAQDARDGCCFFSLESVDYHVVAVCFIPSLDGAAVHGDVGLVQGHAEVVLPSGYPFVLRICVTGIDIGVLLVDRSLEVVYPRIGRVSLSWEGGTIAPVVGSYALFLEVAVCDVVVAPVGHRIELQAVGKLHLVGLAKLLELLPPLAVPLALSRPNRYLP